MKLILTASEAQYEPHVVTGEPPIPLTQPCEITLRDSPIIQITYDTLRYGDDGDEIGRYDDGLWVLTRDMRVAHACMLDGTEGPSSRRPGLRTKGMRFSDIVVVP